MITLFLFYFQWLDCIRFGLVGSGVTRFCLCSFFGLVWFGGDIFCVIPELEGPAGADWKEGNLDNLGAALTHSLAYFRS
jgi:hypothetical protein